MKKTKKILIALIFLSGVVFGSCSDTGTDHIAQLMSTIPVGTISFDDPSSVTLNTYWGFLPDPITGIYGAGFGDYYNIWLLVWWSGSTITMTTYTQDTPGFNFQYLKNNILYTQSGSPGFTFNITSINNARAQGDFSGELVPSGGGANIVITNGTFDSLYF
jgi:hypothetical protein